jgi:hypothetical protein
LNPLAGICGKDAQNYGFPAHGSIKKTPAFPLEAAMESVKVVRDYSAHIPSRIPVGIVGMEAALSGFGPFRLRA